MVDSVGCGAEGRQGFVDAAFVRLLPVTGIRIVPSGLAVAGRRRRSRPSLRTGIQVHIANPAHGLENAAGCNSCRARPAVAVTGQQGSAQ